MLLTLSEMHFQDSETRHVVPHHHLVGSGGLVHALYDLEVAVGVIEVVLMDSHAPGVRQACHYGDAVASIGIAAFNLRRFRETKSNISAVNE